MDYARQSLACNKPLRSRNTWSQYDVAPRRYASTDRANQNLNVDDVGSFFITSTILVMSPSLPLHIFCLKHPIIM